MRAAAATAAHLFRWTGALLFVLSLACFGFFYLFRFESPGAGAGGAAVAWNVGIFTVFSLHHSIFARAPVRRWIARSVSAGNERSFYVSVASLLFIWVCASWRPVAGVAWETEGVVTWMLRLVQAAGVALTVGSAAILDIKDLAGLRGQAPGDGPEEVVFRATGPYGWVRHPIYLGWFLFVFAASPMTMTRLVFAVVSAAYVLVAIPLEERTMRRTSGGAYQRYAAQVRHRLVPGLY